jgi:hypothetical protein
MRQNQFPSPHQPFAAGKYIAEEVARILDAKLDCSSQVHLALVVGVFRVD